MSYSNLTSSSEVYSHPSFVVKRTVRNAAPMTLEVTVYKPDGKQLSFSLDPYQTKYLDVPDGSGLVAGSKLLEMPPYTVRPPDRTLILGGIGADSWGDVNNHVLYADLPGVFIFNHFKFPVEVHYRDNLVARIRGSTSERDVPSVYFTNSRNGLLVDDELGFGTRGKVFMTTKIYNAYIRNMHLGSITSL
jgi:hypothetical protein